MNSNKIFKEDLSIINIGLKIFYDALMEQNVEVINIQWKPPVKKDETTEKLLGLLMGRDNK